MKLLLSALFLVFTTHFHLNAQGNFSESPVHLLITFTRQVLKVSSENGPKFFNNISREAVDMDYGYECWDLNIISVIFNTPRLKNLNPDLNSIL